MASVRSLVIKIGANSDEVDKTLSKLGADVLKTAADMQKIGGTPLGQEAIASFKRMDEAMKGVASAQKTIADNASNTARGIEAMGGVSKFTERELAALNKTVRDGISAYQALGQQAPKELQKVADAISQKLAKPTQGLNASFGDIIGTVGKFASAVGIGFSVGAVVSFGKSLLDDADALVKLSDKTGITIEGLQRLQVAGDDAGNSIDDITSAVTQMENRVAGGDSSAVAALNKLNINFQQFSSLSPEDQFVAISDALRQIQNPAEQVNVAMDLFGRTGANVLPTLKRGFDDLKDASVGMSAETARNLDAVADAFARMYRAAKGHIANTLVEFAKLAKEAAIPTSFAGDVLATTKQIEEMTKAIKPAGQEMAKLPPIIAPTGESLAHLNQRLDDQREKMNKAEDATRKIAAENLRFRDSVVNLTSSTIGAAKGFGAYGALLPELIGNTGMWREELDTLSSRTLPDLQIKLQNVGKDAGQSFKEAIVQTMKFGDVLLGIPKILSDSFTGGGGLSGAVKAIGVQIGEVLVANMRASVKKNVAAGGIGIDASSIRSAAGAGAGAGVGALSTGASGGQAAGAVGGAALATVVGAVASHATLAATVALGAATLGVGLAAVGAYAAIRKLLNDPEKKINPLRQGFIDSAGGLSALNEQAQMAGVTLARLLDAKNPQQYQAAIEELSAAFQFQDQAMATLEETTRKYGFTIEELGPAFQRQELGKKAQELYQDFQVLTSAGVSVEAVIGRMGDSINAFVQSAIATGTEVPAALKPMLQQMVDMGRLTDASGNAFGSLEDAGISFSETMSQGFTRVVDEVKRLTEAISRGLGLAIENVPDPEVTGHVRWNIDPVPLDNQDNFASQGGRVTANGIQHFANGGRVLRFAPRGSDTVPAMLTPGEVVLTRNQQRAVSSAIGAGGAGGSDVIQKELQLHRQLLNRFLVEMPERQARLTRDAVQKARKSG